MRELNEQDVLQVSGGNPLLRWAGQVVLGGAAWDGVKAVSRHMTRPNEALDNGSSNPVSDRSTQTPSRHGNIHSSTDISVTAR